MPYINIYDGQAPFIETELGMLREVASFLGIAPELLRDAIQTKTPAALAEQVAPFALALGFDAEEVVESLRNCIHNAALAPPMEDDVN